MFFLAASLLSRPVLLTRPGSGLLALLGHSRSPMCPTWTPTAWHGSPSLLFPLSWAASHLLRAVALLSVLGQCKSLGPRTGKLDFPPPPRAPRGFHTWCWVLHPQPCHIPRAGKSSSPTRPGLLCPLAVQAYPQLGGSKVRTQNGQRPSADPLGPGNR